MPVRSIRHIGVVRLRHALSLSVCMIGLMLSVSACRPVSLATPIPTAAPATRLPQPLPQSTQAASAPAAAITLTFWMPEFLSPAAAQPAGPEIARQLATFAVAQDDGTLVEPIIKARYGKGGLLDYLLSAQPVAPSILPDVIVLDVAELQSAAEADLLQPLGGLLDEALLAGLYPFARTAGEFGDELLAVQWLADFEHAVLLPDQLSTPPAQWASLFTESTSYLFALSTTQAGSTQAAADGISRAALSHYLSAGGAINPADRSLTLGPDALRRLLEFYQGADQAGLLPPNALELADGDAVWSIFAQGQMPLAQVSARRFLRERNIEDVEPQFSPAPGWADYAPPIATGWALAIVTPDPARQKAAAALISWLLQAEHAGASAAVVGWLPTTPAALATWPISPYIEFVDQQLSVALSLPASPDYPEIAARLQQAITSVVKDDSQVDAAMAAALSTPR